MSKEAELKKNDQQEQQKGFTMERQQVLDQLQSTPLWDAKAGLQTEKDKQDYERQQALSMYKRVLTNSDKREYVSTLLNKKQEAWEIDTTVGHLPKKKLAVARKDKLVAHNENARLKRFKESRKDANLCTVRVFNSMYAYFEGDGYQKKALSANNEEADPTLSAYTQKILSASFDPKMFTEEYFSEHAVEMYEMMCKYADLEIVENYLLGSEGRKQNTLFSLQKNKNANVNAYKFYSDLSKNMGYNVFDANSYGLTEIAQSLSRGNPLILWTWEDCNGKLCNGHSLVVVGVEGYEGTTDFTLSVINTQNKVNNLYTTIKWNEIEYKQLVRFSLNY